MGHNIVSGPISSFLGELIDLTFLDLSSNQLNGSIPPEIGDLTHLSYFDLSSNFLTGRIPWSLDQLTNLYSLNLSASQMDGMVPPDLGGLPSLSELDLSSNQLSGHILNLQLTNATQLLDLLQNQLTGPLPKKLEQLSNLLYLGLKLAYTMVVTEKYDVYSFGVVALATIMGKHPGELISSLASLSAQNIMLSDVLDSHLPYPTNPTVLRNIVLAATLAFACVHSEPRSRPTMLFVSQELLVCKKTLATPFRALSP
ncbi:LRR receptor-like serine/threonine-protein kinase ERL2 [Camellia lanceoleosa]|uniref:LRR receptor-like serine/threonine-protein kinase ERL2 n=1 Tax=Camellia lanceoleosa TaxID=1840588 RepID=A0ACC0J6R6_9ERIC|nr:LRR receptor-like serine/threonine-protein kinase ERL2 [Camellia lanceoleosa]